MIVLQNMKVNGIKIKNMVQGNVIMKINLFIMENFLKTRDKVQVFVNFMIKVIIKDNGLMIK